MSYDSFNRLSILVVLEMKLLIIVYYYAYPAVCFFILIFIFFWVEALISVFCIREHSQNVLWVKIFSIRLPVLL